MGGRKGRRVRTYSVSALRWALSARPLSHSILAQRCEMSISADGHTRRPGCGGVNSLVQGHVAGREQGRNVSSAPSQLRAAASPGNSAPRSSILSLRPLHAHQRLIGCQIEFVDVISWAPHWTLYGSYCSHFK